MKFKDGIMITEVGGQKILVDAGTSGDCFHGIVKLNETGALIAEMLMTGTTLDEIVSAMVSKYGIEEGTARTDVEAFLAQIDRTNFVED